MSHESETVILLHGFASHSIVMEPLRWRLQRSGFATDNWTYPTFTQSLATIGKDFAELLKSYESLGRNYHIVAHSMGSIVVRAAVAGTRLNHLKRLVFLAPPNKGLATVRRMPQVIRRLVAPWNDLSDDPNSFVNRLPHSEGLQVGVIAARFDLLVPVASTHLQGELVHIVLNETHNSILISNHTFRHVLSFLKNDHVIDPAECDDSLKLAMQPT